MYRKCSSIFTVKNWDREGEFPDFLGECFNQISRDTIEAIVNSDKKLRVMYGLEKDSTTGKIEYSGGGYSAQLAELLKKVKK